MVKCPRGLGQRILARDVAVSESSKLAFAERSVKGGNILMASDLVAALMREASTSIDYKGLKVKGGEFRYFTFSERGVRNLSLETATIDELVLPPKAATNVSIVDSVCLKVSGISSAAGLPSWIRKLEADRFDSVESVSRIRRIGLKPSHEILITIIRKTFFQKGAGRKEEALLRGLGRVASKNMATRILNLMVNEGLLTTFRGNEGDVYAPVRSHTRRMQDILDKLRASDDPLWRRVGEM